MLPTTIIIHGNLQYAEISPDKIPLVIKNSYRPTLNGLLQIPKIKILLNFTGVTLEILRKDYPDIVDTINKGIKSGVFEIMGSAYGHPILPLISREEIHLHIKKHLSLLDQLFVIKNPKGFWPPELAWDNRLISILQSHNFKWIPVDFHMIQRSEGKKIVNLNKLMVDWKDSTNKRFFRFKFEKIPQILLRFKKELSDLDFHPRIIQETIHKNPLYAVPIKQVFSPYYTYLATLFPFLRLQNTYFRIAKKVSSDSIFIPFASDLELIGYGGYMKFHVSVAKFLSFIQSLVNSHHLLLGSPTEFLDQKSDYKPIALQTGSWGPEGDFSIWTKGETNKQISALCQEIRSILPSIPNKDIVSKIYELLLLAEGSDGRGWDPLSIRKEFCLNNAKNGLLLAKESLS